MDLREILGLATLLVLGLVGLLLFWLRTAGRRRGAPPPGPSERVTPGDDAPSATGLPPPDAPTAPSAPTADGRAVDPTPLPARFDAGPLVLAPRTAPRHPLVFAHGFLGAERVGPPVIGQDYFRGVRRHLARAGFDAYFVRVSPTASIERRAAQLGAHIERMGRPVNVIAHSMGGLDARFAISRLGLDRHVASLTTVGTPHHGTPLADATVSMIGSWRRLRQALDAMGWNVDGLFDLTTPRMEAFNRDVPDDDHVQYRSYVGRITTGPGDVHALLAPGFAYLWRRAGHNDGIVPAASQRWGEVSGELDADHWAQIGWSGGFDAQAFYLSVVDELIRDRL